jgi:hypothetical protein
VSNVVLSGDIVATGSEVLTIVADPSGSVQFRSNAIFAGAIGGWGLFEYHFTGAASLSGLSGVIILDSGMDQLMALRGQVNWQGTGATFSHDGYVRLPRTP